MAGTDLRLQPIEQQCPGCNAASKRYTHNQARFFGCPSCGAWFQLKKDNKLVPDKKKPFSVKNFAGDPLKPGKRMLFGEIPYILISRAEKADHSGMEYRWREYALFHPAHGYAWLSEYDGHWLLLKKMPAVPDRKLPTEFEYDQKQYHPFQKYKTATISAIGEFPSNELNESARFHEYISPPYLLSCESAKSYHEWLLGESVFRDDVAKAAGISKKELPSQSGVGAVQVRKTNFTHRSLVLLSSITIGLALIIMIFANTSMKEITVVNMNQSVPDSLMGTTIASAPFKLEGRTSDLSFDYYSDVNNTWAEAEIMLINDQTNETRGLSIGSEHYSGFDDGGSWSEGDQRDVKILSSVAPGTYHLNVKHIKSNGGSGGNNFRLEVKHDVPIDSNFFITALLITLFPVISWIRRRQFEKSRWMNSDYSPFNTFEDE